MTALAVLALERGLTAMHYRHHVHGDHGENCCELLVCLSCSHPHDCSTHFKFYTLGHPGQYKLSLVWDINILNRAMENPGISSFARVDTI